MEENAIDHATDGDSDTDALISFQNFIIPVGGCVGAGGSGETTPSSLSGTFDPTHTCTGITLHM